jgi:hypothetical protein
MTLPLREAAARFGYRGELREVKVTRTGPSGRPLDITFEGDHEPMVVDGHRFWAELSLRSTLFTLRTDVAVPAVEGEPLATGVPDLGAFAGPGGEPAPGVTGVVVVDRLGRAPWVALAVLLLAAWGTMAGRVRLGPRPAPAVEAPAPDHGPDEGPRD